MTGSVPLSRVQGLETLSLAGQPHLQVNLIEGVLQGVRVVLLIVLVVIVL